MGDKITSMKAYSRHLVLLYKLDDDPKKQSIIHDEFDRLIEETERRVKEIQNQLKAQAPKPKVIQ